MVEGKTILSCNRIALVIAASFWLYACGGGGGGPEPAPPPPPPPSTLLTLTGSVTDTTGSAISGVQVLLGLTETKTNASGVFSFNNLQAGNYQVSIQDSEGYFDSQTLRLSATTDSYDFTLPNSSGGFRVTKVYPLLNSGNAPLLGQLIIETTSEPNLATLTDSNLIITPDIGDFSVTYEAPELIIQPRLQQPVNQTVIVELTSGVKNTAGTALSHSVRWRFKTSASDFSPPVLINQSPIFGEVKHSPNQGLSFEFNEPVSISGATFSANSTGEIELSARAIGRIIVLDPVGGWEPLSDYIATLSGVEDLFGNTVSGTFRVSFTTDEKPAFSENLDPEWHATTDEIVFASDRNGSFDIFSIRPDGLGLIQLTNLPGDELNPTLSFSGTTLAFQHRDIGSKWDILTQARDSFEPETITPSESNDYDPQFSRTPSDIVFFTSDRVTPSGLFNMHYEGATPTELDLEFNSWATAPVPHPLLDTQLLFVSSRGGSQDIWRKTISAIDGTTINLNLTGDSLSKEHSPAWLPDAGSIIYISNESGTDNLWLTDAAGTFPRQVTLFDDKVSDPWASPHPGDELAVVVIHNPGGGTDLVLVDLVGGEITVNLTNPDGGEAEDQ